MQVVLVDRRLAQPAAHPLESLLQLAQLVPPPDIHRTRVVALADAVGSLDQRSNGLFQFSPGAPGQARTQQACHQGQSARQKQPSRT